MPAGLWIDERPILDIFAMLPFQLAEALFHDPKQGESPLQRFMVRSSRSLGTAGKILFPIPNRRVSKRLYRQTAATLVVWGRNDHFIEPIYAERWVELLQRAELAWIEEAGHRVPYEQPAAVAQAIAAFLDQRAR